MCVCFRHALWAVSRDSIIGKVMRYGQAFFGLFVVASPEVGDGVLQIIEFSQAKFGQSHAKENFAFSPTPFYFRKGGQG